MAKLGAIGAKTSLRYAVQLLNPAWIYAKTQGRKEITEADIDQVNQLFVDSKASAKILQEQADKFIN